MKISEIPSTNDISPFPNNGYVIIDQLDSDLHTHYTKKYDILNFAFKKDLSNNQNASADYVTQAELSDYMRVSDVSLLDEPYCIPVVQSGTLIGITPEEVIYLATTDAEDVNPITDDNFLMYNIPVFYNDEIKTVSINSIVNYIQNNS